MKLSLQLIDALALFEKADPITVAEAAQFLEITKSAAWSRVTHLVDLGQVEHIGERYRIGLGEVKTFAITDAGRATCRLLYGPWNHLYRVEESTEDHLYAQHEMSERHVEEIAREGKDELIKMHMQLHDQPPYDEP